MNILHLFTMMNELRIITDLMCPLLTIYVKAIDSNIHPLIWFEALKMYNPSYIFLNAILWWHSIWYNSFNRIRILNIFTPELGIDLCYYWHPTWNSWGPLDFYSKIYLEITRLNSKPFPIYYNIKIFERVVNMKTR